MLCAHLLWDRGCQVGVEELGVVLACMYAVAQAQGDAQSLYAYTTMLVAFNGRSAAVEAEAGEAAPAASAAAATAVPAEEREEVVMSKTVVKATDEGERPVAPVDGSEPDEDKHASKAVHEEGTVKVMPLPTEQQAAPSHPKLLPSTPSEASDKSFDFDFEL